MRNLDIRHPVVIESMVKIETRLEYYTTLLAAHPLLEMAATGRLARPVADEFAYLQYVDSILWVPMLALMKERVSRPRLLRAIAENLACEAGYRGTSHVELARQFVESLGLFAPPPGCPVPDVVDTVTHWTRFPEPQIAGWLLAAETLVPLLFTRMRPSFASLPGADLRYLDEHVHVDSDDHAVWMKEAVAEILCSPSSLPAVLVGVDFGAREVFDVPDVLYTHALKLGEREA